MPGLVLVTRRRRLPQFPEGSRAPAAGCGPSRDPDSQPFAQRCRRRALDCGWGTSPYCSERILNRAAGLLFFRAMSVRLVRHRFSRCHTTVVRAPMSPGVWERMLDPEPVAVLTPWQRGGRVLPSRRDRQRILSLTSNTYGDRKDGFNRSGASPVRFGRTNDPPIRHQVPTGANARYDSPSSLNRVRCSVGSRVVRVRLPSQRLRQAVAPRNASPDSAFRPIRPAPRPCVSELRFAAFCGASSWPTSSNRGPAQRDLPRSYPLSRRNRLGTLVQRDGRDDRGDGNHPGRRGTTSYDRPDSSFSLPVLSPKFSTRTPSRCSMVSCRFVIGF